MRAPDAYDGVAILQDTMGEPKRSCSCLSLFALSVGGVFVISLAFALVRAVMEFNITARSSVLVCLQSDHGWFAPWSYNNAIIRI